MAIYDNIDGTEFEETFPDSDVIDVKAFELDGGVYCAKCVGCDGSPSVYIEQVLKEEFLICDR